MPLSETPAGIPPPGVTPNFIDPQTLVPALIAVNLVMILWTISFVVIRLYVNSHARRGLAMDDCETYLFHCAIRMTDNTRLLYHRHGVSFRMYGLSILM